MDKNINKEIWQRRFVISIIVCIGLLASTVGFYIFKEIEKNKRIEIEGNLQRTIELKEAVEEDLRKEKVRAMDLAKELVKKKNKLRIALVNLEEKEKTVQDLTAELEKESDAKAELETRFEDVQAQLKLVLRGREALEKKLERMMSRSTRYMDLGKIVVKANPIIEGRVLVVNKEYEFVIIDLGRENNIRQNAIFKVYRDNEVVGKVQAKEVFADMSEAVILPEWQTKPIKEDDIVRKL